MSPCLFSIFLDPEKSVKAPKSVSFLFDIRVLMPDYDVDGILFLKRHYEGGSIYRKLILVEALPDKNAPGGWRVKYGLQDINPGKPGAVADARRIQRGNKTIGLEFDIDIEQKTRPGLCGTLRIEAYPWT